MNSEQIEGKWKQFSGKVREQWGKLTESDINVINGKREQLIGKIQERYGIAKEEAQRQVDDFFKTMSDHDTSNETANDRRARGAGRS